MATGCCNLRTIRESRDLKLVLWLGDKIFPNYLKKKLEKTFPIAFLKTKKSNFMMAKSVDDISMLYMLNLEHKTSLRGG